jgi:hypothetical protein
LSESDLFYGAICNKEWKRINSANYNAKSINGVEFAGENIICVEDFDINYMII